MAERALKRDRHRIICLAWRSGKVGQSRQNVIILILQLSWSRELLLEGRECLWPWKVLISFTPIFPPAKVFSFVLSPRLFPRSHEQFSAPFQSRANVNFGVETVKSSGRSCLIHTQKKPPPSYANRFLQFHVLIIISREILGFDTFIPFTLD